VTDSIETGRTGRQADRNAGRAGKSDTGTAGDSRRIQSDDGWGATVWCAPGPRHQTPLPTCTCTWRWCCAEDTVGLSGCVCQPTSKSPTTHLPAHLPVTVLLAQQTHAHTQTQPTQNLSAHNTHATVKDTCARSCALLENRRMFLQQPAEPRTAETQHLKQLPAKAAPVKQGMLRAATRLKGQTHILADTVVHASCSQTHMLDPPFPPRYTGARPVSPLFTVKDQHTDTLRNTPTPTHSPPGQPLTLNPCRTHTHTHTP
jgi:hypothetical protein